MKKYKCIFFDLDGTLLNTIDDITNALNYALLKYNPDQMISFNQTKTYIGSGVKVLVERAMKDNKIDPCLKEEFLNDYMSYYSRHRNDLTKPYSRSKEVIKELKRMEKILGVISNKPNEDTVKCVDHYFGNLFDIVTGQIEGVKTKPNPDIFNFLIEKHNLKKEEILYVGDMNVDLFFARNVGVDVALVTFGFGLEIKKMKPDYFIDHYDELLKF